MTVATGIVVFLIIWWLVLFAVLPWGVRGAPDTGEGHAEGAPINPRLGIKVGVTTAITCVLWGLAYWLIESGAISFR